MLIRVKLIRSNKIKKIQINKNSIILDLLRRLDLKPDTVIVMKDNMPLSIDEPLDNNQEVSIIQVSSGG